MTAANRPRTVDRGELPDGIEAGVAGHHGPLDPFEVDVAPNGNGEEPLPPTEPTPERKARHRLVRAVVLVSMAGVVALAAFLYDPSNLFEDDEPTGAPARDTATVATATLTAAYEAQGQVVYSDSVDITAAGAVGVVTEIVEPETTLHRGDVLWRVVDEPVVVLFGGTPASRSLAQGDVGVDVRQLEENLVALGYDADATVTVDDEYTAYTAAMVERWQTDIGAEVTGVVADGAVVFLDGIARVGATGFEVGDSLGSGETVLSVTRAERVVEFTVPSSERATVAIGDVVAARLPDRTTVDATVTTTVGRSDGGADVTADLAGAIDYAVDTVPVTVTWEVPLGSNVLTVPAGALIRTDDGALNLEVRRSSGIEELVPVEVGRSSGTTVEIIGDIADGDEVIAP